MYCIIPCAGQGTRLALDTPKSLIEVAGQPILHYIIEAWSLSVEKYVIIANPDNEASIKRYCSYRSDFFEIIVQKEPKGLADAILCAEPHVKDEFIITLGDCLYLGEFDIKPFKLGLGVWKPEDSNKEVLKNYSIETDGEFIKRLVEKPTTVSSWCGMGVYFLNCRLFSYIRSRQSGDFTEVIQSMIDTGEKISPVRFNGHYVNVNTSEDLANAEKMLARKLAIW